MASQQQVLPKAVALPCLLLWTATLGWYWVVDLWWSHGRLVASSSLLVAIDQEFWFSHCLLSLLFNKYTTVHCLTAQHASCPLLHDLFWDYHCCSTQIEKAMTHQRNSSTQLQLGEAMEFSLYTETRLIWRPVTEKLPQLGWRLRRESWVGWLAVHYWRASLVPVIVYLHNLMETPFQSLEFLEPEWPSTHKCFSLEELSPQHLLLTDLCQEHYFWRKVQ